MNKIVLKRKEANDQLVKRMRDGETLSSFDPQLSFFPPRPIIKKDLEAMQTLFSTDDK